MKRSLAVLVAAVAVAACTPAAPPVAPLRGRPVDWSADVAPIFRRACAACHLPGGPGGLDLGTKDAWDARREAIRRRVIVDRSMPPTGLVLPGPDRAVIRAFLDGPVPPGRGAEPQPAKR